MLSSNTALPTSWLDIDTFQRIQFIYCLAFHYIPYIYTYSESTPSASQSSDGSLKYCVQSLHTINPISAYIEPLTWIYSPSCTARLLRSPYHPMTHQVSTSVSSCSEFYKVFSLFVLQLLRYRGLLLIFVSELHIVQ